jgi:hypothetical protein
MVLIAHRTPLTAAGCAELAAAGAGAFELDVQLIDGRLVVSHYVTLAHLPAWLEHDNWRFRRRGRPPHDLAFDEMVALVPGDCLVLLDPKLRRDTDRALLTDAVIRGISDPARFRVSTADPDDLRRYRAAGVRTWRTIGNRADLRDVLTAESLPEEGVSVRQWHLDGAVLGRLHDLVPTVVAWTVNDPARSAHGLPSGWLSACGNGSANGRPTGLGATARKLSYVWLAELRSPEDPAVRLVSFAYPMSAPSR